MGSHYFSFWKFPFGSDGKFLNLIEVMVVQYYTCTKCRRIVHFKTVDFALAGQLNCLAQHPIHQKDAGLIPVQGTYLCFRCDGEAPDQCSSVSPSLPPFSPLSLKSIKTSLREGFLKTVDFIYHEFYLTEKQKIKKPSKAFCSPHCALGLALRAHHCPVQLRPRD